MAARCSEEFGLQCNVVCCKCPSAAVGLSTKASCCGHVPLHHETALRCRISATTPFALPGVTRRFLARPVNRLQRCRGRMRPLGSTDWSPTSTSVPLAPSCGCSRPTDGHFRQQRPFQKRSAAAAPVRLRLAACVSPLSSTTALSQPSPASVRLRGQLQVVAAGGPSGGLAKSRSPRGSEVSSSLIDLIASCRSLRLCMLAVVNSGTMHVGIQVVLECICGFWNLLQVDTPGKKLLVGVAVSYVLLVLLVPTANIFIQVHCCLLRPDQLQCCRCNCVRLSNFPTADTSRLVAGVFEGPRPLLTAHIRPGLSECGAHNRCQPCTQCYSVNHFQKPSASHCCRHMPASLPGQSF